MQEVIKALVYWIGTDPAKHTLGGWGYMEVAKFFNQHTSLTINDVYRLSMSVKQRYEYCFNIITPEEKSKIIRSTLSIFPMNNYHPQRTEALKDYLEQVATQLSWTQYQAIIENYKKILKIDSLDSAENLKIAYKVQMQSYHPDKVASLGDELKELAEKKTKEINEAYSYLKNIIERK